MIVSVAKCILLSGFLGILFAIIIFVEASSSFSVVKIIGSCVSYNSSTLFCIFKFATQGQVENSDRRRKCDSFRRQVYTFEWFPGNLVCNHYFCRGILIFGRQNYRFMCQL